MPLAERAGECDLLSSEIALTEVPRAVQRAAARVGAAIEPALASAEALFESLGFVPLTRGLLIQAGSFSSPGLRSLDAIHIASALEVVGALTAFVSYDNAQLRHASAAGLAMESPA